MKLLMITGDRALVAGKHGAFYNTLEEFHKYWDRIDIVCPKVSKLKIKNLKLFDNVFIHPSPWPLLFQPFWIFYQGFQILKTSGYSLAANNYLMTVHEYPPFYNGIGAKLVHLFTGVPYILEIMHIPGLPQAAGPKETIYRWLTRFFIGFDAQSARAVRVINRKQTKKYLTAAGVPESKIIYIPAFYIDLDIFKPVPANTRFDLVYAARLEANKGIQNLVKAVSILKKDKPSISLLVIGSGPLRSRTEKDIKKLGLRDNVIFSGWLKDQSAVAQAMNKARIFVNPSLNEGGPRVALEAMACGLPVVTTRVGVMLDIIRDGENGIFCGWEPESIAEAVAGLLKDDDLQKKLKSAGPETVKIFSRKELVKNYADELMKLI